MARQKAQQAEKTQAVENRRAAFDLRKRGFTYQEIGDKLGVSVKTAYEYVQKILTDLAAETREDAEAIRKLELERCDMLLKGLEPMAQVGNPGAVTAYLKVLERRSKYLGLDAPEKKDLTSDGKPLKGYIGVSPDDWDTPAE